MKFLKLVLLVFLMMNLVGCSPRIKQSFGSLSKPEKKWVIFHPFKAKRAYLISIEAERVKDSMIQARTIGADTNGGNIDALKHSYWMARLSQGIGKRAALTLGKAHEKGNYQTFKARRLEDGFLPDKPSTLMDLHNNRVGISVGVKYKKYPKNRLISVLLDSLKKGKLRILKKDSSGNFLDCSNEKIPLDSLKGKWDIKKCLIPSS